MLAILLAPSTGAAQYLLEHVIYDGGELRFLNAAEGFSFNSRTIRYTADSGRTWDLVTEEMQEVTGGAGIMDAAFVDRNTGWVIAYYGGGINTPIDTTCIFATTDGGTTWRKQRTSLPSKIKWASQTFQGIRFTDAMNGWVFGLGVIEHTTDGGATWTTQLRWKEDAIYDDLFTTGYFRNAREGWIAGYGSFILHTTDAGATWVTQHVDTATREDGVPLNTETYTLISIHFADSLNGYVATTHGNYLYTRDGGASWHAGSTGYPNDNVEVFMRDSDMIWQVGGNYCDNSGCYSGQSILYSADGGASWKPVIATTGELGSTPQFVSIAWITPRLGYVSNEYGEIFRIRDTSSSVAGVDRSREEEENGITVYPNPAREMLHVELADGSGETRVNIYDPLGRIVSSAGVNAVSGITIGTSALSPGSYILEAINNGKRMRRKVTVVR
jgi:photosystem II stability/assembly factor-like uncharacterized protein